MDTIYTSVRSLVPVQTDVIHFSLYGGWDTNDHRSELNLTPETIDVA